MHRILFIALIAIAANGCNSSDTKSPGVESETKQLTAFQQNWTQMRSTSTKIIFKKYNLGPDSNVLRCENCEIWSDSTVNLKTIANFSTLFNGVKDGGYCCCPFSHFSVTFFREKKEIGKYFVDTSYGNALFFDRDYQTSYLIDVMDWTNYLTRQTNYR